MHSRVKSLGLRLSASPHHHRHYRQNVARVWKHLRTSPETKAPLRSNVIEYRSRAYVADASNQRLLHDLLSSGLWKLRHSVWRFVLENLLSPSSSSIIRDSPSLRQSLRVSAPKLLLSLAEPRVGNGDSIPYSDVKIRLVGGRLLDRGKRSRL